MKKNILSFIAVSVLIIFSACAQQKKTTSKVSTATPATKAIQQLVMERTACFGTCPAYRLEINKDGKVIFTSWHFTKYEGVYEKSFAPAEVSKLFRQFESYKVDTCSEEYFNQIQDMPGVNYYFTYKDKKSKIINAHFGPDFLNMLSKETDAFSQVDESWKKTADAEK